MNDNVNIANDYDALTRRIDENHRRIAELQERSRQVLAEIKELLSEEITEPIPGERR